MKPIFNAHIHVFTHESVPDFIAKKILPWPLHRIITIKTGVWLFGHYKSFIRWWDFKWVPRRKRLIGWLKSSFVGDYFFTTLILALMLYSILALMQLLGQLKMISSVLSSEIFTTVSVLLERSAFLNVGVIILTSLISDKGRKFILFLLKALFKPLQWLPKSALESISRYLNIIKFSDYSSQKLVFQKLYKLYPPQSSFILLPMDMEYMDAGPTAMPYLNQLAEINSWFGPKGEKSKVPYDRIYPFIFVDPRRIEQDIGDKVDYPFFDWDLNSEGEVFLKNCVLKDYLEDKEDAPDDERWQYGNFKGIKLYPAIGYYPFDQWLLPLYLYCVQRMIPLTTHCTLGSIYYRGRMRSEWLKHPVFTQNDRSTDIPQAQRKRVPLSTPFESNHQLQKNFTHPLNYLVLLEDEYLKCWLEKLGDERLNKAFGVATDSFKSLRELKINIAHYGGSKEWMKYMEMDTEESSQDMIKRPDKGMELLMSASGDYAKPAWIWSQGIDWYSVISAMMIKYPKIYADISYILHNDFIRPLLIQSLQNDNLKSKVLFGTDFYVVRNHKTEKQLYAEITADLSEEHLDLIANKNVKDFLWS